MISILLPVFNEGKYLSQCIESILIQDEDDYEVCISDNASTDDSWSIIERYSRFNIRINAFRQPSKILPFDNLLYTLSQAKGEYVYLFAGDDYLLPGFFRSALSYFEIMPDLQVVNQKIYAFNDQDGSIICASPVMSYENKINTSNSQLVDFVLKHNNCDELILGLFKRSPFIETIKMLNHTTLDNFWIWVFLGICLQGKNKKQRQRIIKDIYMMKRYNKSNSNSYDIDSAQISLSLYKKNRLYWLKIYGSTYNAFKLYFEGLYGFRELLKMLFGSRYHASFGFSNVAPLLSPLWGSVFLPLRQIRRIILSSSRS